MEINFEKYAVAYLDILGFSEFIKKAENSQKALKILDTLLNRIITKQIQADEINICFPKQLKLECLSFSDSIVISAPVGTAISPFYPALIAVSIKAIQIAHALLGRGFLVRGAISVGNVHRSESNIVGTGYQDAVKGEQSAIYPKIMLNHSAESHLNELVRNGMTRFSIFSKDEHGKVILNSIYPSEYYVDDQSKPITKYYSIYKKYILQNMDKGKLENKDKDKWCWIAKLFNSNVNCFSELNGIPPIRIPEIVPNYLNPEKESTWFGDAFTEPPLYVSSNLSNGR